MKRTFILSHSTARVNASEAVREAPQGYCVTIAEPTRSLEQNAAQWPILQEFASQKQLCVNGELVWASADDWKDVLTAAFEAEMRVAVFQGRMILLGQRTREFGKKKFGDWLEFLHSMAVEMGVNIQYREAA